MDPRVTRVEALLERAGIAASVTVAGLEGEIAAVRAGHEVMPELRRLAPRIRALGFRSVALELGPSEAE